MTCLRSVESRIESGHEDDRCERRHQRQDTMFERPAPPCPGRRWQGLGHDLGWCTVATKTLEIGHQLAGPLVTLLRFAFEAAPNDTLQLCRNLRSQIVDGRRIGGGDGEENRLLVVGGERAPARHHLVENGAHGPQIAATVGLISGRLLG